MFLARAMIVSTLLTAAVPLSAAADEVDPTMAVDILLGALRHQGRNPTQIRSGDIRYRERVRSADQDRSSKAGLIAKLEKLAADSPSDIGREQWKDEIRRIQNEEAAGPQAMQPVKTWIKRDVFEGNNPRKRSREEARLGDAEEGFTSEQVLLVDRTGPETANLKRFSEAHSTSLSIDQFGSSPIEQLGRARSPMALAITTLLLANGGNHDAFNFSPSSTASLKQVFETAATEGTGGKGSPHVVATRTFEGSEVFDIEFGMRESPSFMTTQARLLRISVDPSRGYVVPVEEEWHDGKRVLRLESSDYRQASEDGLWFPWQSKETHYDPATGEVVSEREWHVTEATLNEPIDPREFEVTIPAGEAIDDSRRSNVATPYRTTATVTIGARVPPGDLTSTPGISKAVVLTGRHLPDASAWSWGRRLSLVGTTAVLFTLLAIAVRRRRRG